MSTYSQFHRVQKFSWKKGSRLWETKRIENVYSKCFFFGNDFVAGFRAWCKTEKCLMMMIRWPFAFAFRLSYFEKMKNFYQTKKKHSRIENPTELILAFLLVDERCFGHFLLHKTRRCAICWVPWRRAWWLIGLVCKSMPLTIFSRAALTLTST